MLDYAAFPQQRQNKIRQRLRDHGRVVCAVLAREMRVSEHTVRRDLNQLAQEGLCRRVHGGAVSIQKESGTFEQRASQDHAEKINIAQKCASLIKKQACVFIDSGSTNLAIARCLPDDLAITVATNSPAIALELMKKSSCEVILIGGKLTAQIGASVDSTAVRQMSQIYFDQCILGGCALDPQMGVTLFDYAEAEFKKVLIERSNQVIMGVTSDKLPSVARYSVADCEQLSILVVDKNLAQETISLFANNSLKIILSD